MKTKKTTAKAFQEIMIIQKILPALQFKGTRMIFPYTWNGNPLNAVIELQDLISIIKFDQKK